MDDLLVCLQPIELEGWPTQTVTDPVLRYQMRMHKGWGTTPQASETPWVHEHLYRGPAPAELLDIQFMGKADPAASLRNWVEATMQLLGLPLESLVVPPGPPPRLLEWQYGGHSRALLERLAADEMHLYQGLAALPGEARELARLYVLLIRRQTHAWKIGLSFSSACLPGMPETLVAANDHVRAGATFGYLNLL